jgi:type II secretory pathway component GspD/PulD (secretin)
MFLGVRFQMGVLRTLLIFVFVISFVAMIGFVKVKADSTIVDINDAIAIVSTAMGIKIIVEGDLKGQISLELDNLSPREIKERLEKSLNEAGFYWVSEGGIVYITKNGRGPRTLFGRQLPLSYYLEVIARNNLFRPLGLKPEEVKTNLVLTGIFGIGDNTRAIIEDTITRRSYYVTKGESIGNLNVTEITEGQVVLTGTGGQTILKIQQKGQKG